MKKNSKIISFIVAAIGFFVIEFAQAIDRKYSCLIYALYIIASLLIGNSMIVEIIKACKENGKFAWKESKSLRKNCIAIFIFVLFVSILGFFTLFNNPLGY